MRSVRSHRGCQAKSVRAWLVLVAVSAALCSLRAWANPTLLPVVRQQVSVGVSQDETSTQLMRSEIGLGLEWDILDWRITGLALLEYDGEDRLEPGEVDDLNRSGLSRRWSINPYTTGELRELYADYRLGDWDVRLGKQQIVWGDADGVKILDIVNPQTFREGFLAQSVESRIPLWAALISRRLGSLGSVEWVVQPDLTFHDVPAIDALYTITSPRLAPERPDDVQIPPLETERPELGWDTVEFGTRIQLQFDLYQGSLIAFRHFNDSPNLELQPTNFLGTDYRVLASYKQTHSFGASIGRPLEPGLIRAESLYTHKTPLPVLEGDVTLFPGLPFINDLLPITQSREDFNPNASRVQSLIAMDVPVRSTGLISIQYAHREFMLDERHPDVEAQQRFVTFLWRDEWEAQRLSFEWFAATEVGDGDAFLRLRISKYLSDSWALLLGADAFWGKPVGIFGQFRDLDRVSAGLQWTPEL